jgi:GNAT superfamily N-acetyltransferase
VAVSVRPFTVRDAGAVADVLFVAAAAAFAVPAAARRFVERLLAIDPVGGQVLDEDGEVVGVGWIHPRGRVATIGPLAVFPRHRGRGHGRQLLEACVAAVGERGVQVRMLEDGTDATTLGLAFRCGFRVVTSVLELEAAGSRWTAPAQLPPGLGMRPATAGDEAELVARDARSWGAARPQDIALLLGAGVGAWLERRDRVLAHAFARRGEDTTWLGPATGDDGVVVATLLAALAAECAQTNPGPARVLVPAGDRRCVDALLADGFRVRATLQYLAAGGGTAPPPGYALCSRLLG